MNLPGRSQAEEDAFVARFRDDDDSELIQAVVMAVDARRLTLASRLVGLLDEDVDNPAIARARAAAAMMLHQGVTACDVSWSEIEEAVQEVRRARVRTHKARQRDILRGDQGKRRVSRVSRKRR